MGDFYIFFFRVERIHGLGPIIAQKGPREWARKRAASRSIKQQAAGLMLYNNFLFFHTFPSVRQEVYNGE